MKNYKIRKVSIEDAESLIEFLSQVDNETKFLSREVGELTITKEMEEKLLTKMVEDSNSEFLVCEFLGKIVATCNVFRKSTALRYKHRAGIGVAVLKEFHNLRIATSLIELAIEWCADKTDIEQIELEVIKENASAIHLYEKFGFKKVSKMPNYFKYKDGTYADAYIMIKFLK